MDSAQKTLSDPPPSSLSSATMPEVPQRDDSNLEIYLSDEEKFKRLGEGRYSCKRSKCINVLLVGRSQSGKSTIIKTLLNVYQAVGSTGFSDTKDPIVEYLVVHDKKTGEQYQINLLDTPGLREHRSDDDGTQSRDDDELLRLATRCAQLRITTLNAVCFVGQVNALQMLDLQSFAVIKNFLGSKFSDVSMLVLTHCDNYAEEDLQRFEENIKTNKDSKPYYEFCWRGIFRYGAIDYQHLKKYKKFGLRQEIVQEKLIDNEEMRNRLVEEFIKCADKELSIAELDLIVKTNQAEFDKQVQKRIAEMMKLDPQEMRAEVEKQYQIEKKEMEDDYRKKLAKAKNDERERFEAEYRQLLAKRDEEHKKMLDEQGKSNKPALPERCSMQ